MRKMKWKNFALLTLSVGMLCSCGGGSGVSLEKGKQIFEGNNIYFETGTSENVSAKVEIPAAIQSVKCGRTEAQKGEYCYEDGILTLSHEFLAKINSTGEKSIVVAMSKGKVTLSALIATKIVKTAEDFVAIGKDSVSLQGSYVLANDIDLSSIENFEPLGWYTDEADPNNAYFHGLLEGNGHAVKNAKVYYADSVSSNYNVYSKTGTMFEHEGHTAGDNIGLFQVIGSSGIVRNTRFEDIKVRGRTICGVIAGNVMGTIENCYVANSCSVEMGTHFYDDDCNMGGVAGICAGSGNIHNVISEVTNLQLGSRGGDTVGGVTIEKAGIYVDFDDKYKGETGNGWDHGAPADKDTNAWWKYCAVDRDALDGSGKALDSNGSQSNGIYAFAGKTWGTIENCVSRSFQITPMDGQPRPVNFSQTHLTKNKPTSGDSDLGTLSNNQLLDNAGLKVAANYSAFDTNKWNIQDGKVPTLKSAYSFVALAE